MNTAHSLHKNQHRKEIVCQLRAHRRRHTCQSRPLRFPIFHEILTDHHPIAITSPLRPPHRRLHSATADSNRHSLLRALEQVPRGNNLVWGIFLKSRHGQTNRPLLQSLGPFKILDRRIPLQSQSICIIRKRRGEQLVLRSLQEPTKTTKIGKIRLQWVVIDRPISPNHLVLREGQQSRCWNFLDFDQIRKHRRARHKTRASDEKKHNSTTLATVRVRIQVGMRITRI